MILRLRRGRREHVVEVERAEGRPRVRIDGRSFEADIARTADGFYSVVSGGRSIDLAVVRTPGGWVVHSGGRTYRLRSGETPAPADARGAGGQGKHEVRASLPGKILQVPVEEGSRVREGDGLVVIEAMKMENELRAPFDALVQAVAIRAGQTVETGALLLVLEPLAEPPEEPEE